MSFAASPSHHLTATSATTTAISSVLVALMTLQPSPFPLVLAQRDHPTSSCSAELKVYKYFSTRVEWRAAFVECRNSAYCGQQGELATIRSAEEQTLIEQLGFVRDPYIGGYGGNSGEWKWVGDDALFWSNSGQPLDVTYHNFDTANAEPHGDFDHLFIWRTIGHEFMWGDRQPCPHAGNNAEYYQLHRLASAACQSNYIQCSDGCDAMESGCLMMIPPGDDDSHCYDDSENCQWGCDDMQDECQDAANDAYAFCEDQLHHEFICEYCMEEAGYQGWRTVEGSTVSGYCDGQSRVLIQSYSVHADRAGCHYTQIPGLSLDDTSCGYTRASNVQTLASYATAITIEDVGYGEYRTEEPALLDALKNGGNWHRPEMTVAAWEKMTSHPFDMCIDTSACTSAQSNTNWPHMVDSCSNSQCLRWTINLPSNFKHTFASAHHEHGNGTYFQASRTWLTVPGLCDPTPEPTSKPTPQPTAAPTFEPTVEPTFEPTAAPKTTDLINTEGLNNSVTTGNGNNTTGGGGGAGAGAEGTTNGGGDENSDDSTTGDGITESKAGEDDGFQWWILGVIFGALLIIGGIAAAAIYVARKKGSGGSSSDAGGESTGGDKKGTETELLEALPDQSQLEEVPAVENDAQPVEQTDDVLGIEGEDAFADL